MYPNVHCTTAYNSQDMEAGLRWWRSKTLCSPSPTNTSKNTSTCKMTHMNMYRKLAEELKPPKRARNSLHNWVEQKKREREKESGQD